MRALILTRQDSPVAPNVSFITDWPDSTAGPGEIVVKSEASAMNHLDLWIGRGLPGIDLTYPRVGGSDGCGIVESVGEGVDSSWIGRRVVLNAACPQPDPIRPDHRPAPPDILMIGEHVNGTMAEKFICPAQNVVDVGDVDPANAAAFALTHLTAWRMMWTRARVQPGQWVLITGIGGGVALAALNIARHLGCRTIVTSRHQWKLDKAVELGADHAVLDKGEDWSREVRGLTDKRGVDLCVDSVGKAIHTSCLKALARGGAFVTCGVTSGFDPATDLARVFWNQLSILGSTMGDIDEFHQIISLLKSGAIKPVIDSTFDAQDGQQAYERLESGEQFGKIVVRWR